MNILGINAYHGDSSAAIAKAGELIAASEEERFTREKHWAGVPINAVRNCLREAGMEISEIDYIVLSKNPFAGIAGKLYAAARKNPAHTLSRIEANLGILSVRDFLNKNFAGKNRIRARLRCVEHHTAHIASAYYSSPFNRALVLSCDSAGDMKTAMWARGKGGELRIKGSVRFPHSLGFLYTAFTQFLGFPEYGDEYKVMGLAPYGKPDYKNKIYRVLRTKKDSSFELDLSYFSLNGNSGRMEWKNRRPKLGRLYSDKFIRNFGKPRAPNEALDERHKALASSLQVVLEEAAINLLEKLKSRYAEENLCLSGGIFANSALCGRLSGLKLFRGIFVPSAPADAGTAIGALAHFYYKKTKRRIKNAESAFKGREYTAGEIKTALAASGLKWEELTEDSKLDFAVEELMKRKVVGWFQGKMEFGSRALGNRSILAHPGYSEMKDILNKRIKNRETFRPFAPSVMEEHVSEFFYANDKSPYMSFTVRAKEDKIDKIKAVVHVDNTARIHTVSKNDSPLFHRLIGRFYKRTGFPLLLNTSFNENEPIVNTPEEAIGCFLRTEMDTLVMGDFVIRRKPR